MLLELSFVHSPMIPLHPLMRQGNWARSSRMRSMFSHEALRWRIKMRIYHSVISTIPFWGTKDAATRWLWLLEECWCIDKWWELESLGTSMTANYIRLKIWKKNKQTRKKNKHQTLNIWNQIGGIRDGLGEKNMMASFQNYFQCKKKMIRYS